MTYFQDIDGAKRSMFWGVGSRIRVDPKSISGRGVMHAATVSSVFKSCSEPKEQPFL